MDLRAIQYAHSFIATHCTKFDWTVRLCLIRPVLKPVSKSCMFVQPRFYKTWSWSVKAWNHHQGGIYWIQDGRQWPTSVSGNLRRHQICSIRDIKSHHLNVSRLVLHLSLSIPLKPFVKSRMKMYLEQHPQAMLQLYLSDQQVYCLLGCNLY